MNAPFVEQWQKTYKTALTPLIRWQEITAETAQKQIQLHLAAGKTAVDFGIRHLRLVGETKDLPTWTTEASTLTADFTQTLTDYAGNVFKTNREAQEAVNAWVKQTVESVGDSMNKAAKPR